MNNTSYQDLVNISSFGKQREEFVDDRGQVQFYCKDCGTIVETNRLNPNKYLYECTVCKGKNIAIGTTEGLKDFYLKKH